MKEVIKKLENVLSKVAGVEIDLTYARTNMVTLAWEGENVEVLNRLQEYFNGTLFDYEYEYDAECEMSVCCLNF